jgi:hypothetical protein
VPAGIFWPHAATHMPVFTAGHSNVNIPPPEKGLQLGPMHTPAPTCTYSQIMLSWETGTMPPQAGDYRFN